MSVSTWFTAASTAVALALAAPGAFAQQEQQEEVQQEAEELQQEAEQAAQGAEQEGEQAAQQAAGQAAEGAEVEAEQAEQQAEEAEQQAEQAQQEQQQQQAGGGQEPVEEVAEQTQPSGTLLSSNLRDTPVQNPEGENLADVDDLVIDQDGQVTHVVLGFGGFLGLGTKQVAVPWDRFEVSPEGNLQIAYTAEELEAAPEFQTAEEAQMEQEQRAMEAQPPAGGAGGATAPAPTAPQQQ
jgi:PRC-barrel domain